MKRRKYFYLDRGKVSQALPHYTWNLIREDDSKLISEEISKLNFYVNSRYNTFFFSNESRIAKECAGGHRFPYIYYNKWERNSPVLNLWLCSSRLHLSFASISCSYNIRPWLIKWFIRFFQSKFISFAWPKIISEILEFTF